MSSAVLKDELVFATPPHAVLDKTDFDLLIAGGLGLACERTAVTGVALGLTVPSARAQLLRRRSRPLVYVFHNERKTIGSSASCGHVTLDSSSVTGGFGFVTFEVAPSNERK